MSAFSHNKLYYNGNTYVITAFSGGEPFSANEWGFVPRPAEGFTGYYYQLKVQENRLILDYLDVYDWRGEYPDVNGVSGELEEPGDLYCTKKDGTTTVEHNYQNPLHREYRNVNLFIPYTGNILVGSGFLDVLYEHMGYQKPYAFTNLIELCFEDGTLVKAVDRSRAASRVRYFILADILMGRDPDMSEEEHVRMCFSLDYEDKAMWLRSFPERENEVLFPSYGKAV